MLSFSLHKIKHYISFKSKCFLSVLLLNKFREFRSSFSSFYELFFFCPFWNGEKDFCLWTLRNKETFYFLLSFCFWWKIAFRNIEKEKYYVLKWSFVLFYIFVGFFFSSFISLKWRKKTSHYFYCIDEMSFPLNHK